MKLNDIRKLAKEIREGKCEMGFDEICNTLVEIDQYMNSEAAAGWTERTKNILAEERKQIEGYAVSIAPQKLEEVTDDAEIVRKNFKTVVQEMQGKQFPVLEAIRWFATVYGKDGYEKVRCIKGMIERRGYKVFWSGEKDACEFTIIGEHGNRLGSFNGPIDGVVQSFEICGQVA